MITRYEGVKQLSVLDAAVDAVAGGVVSPGGAAAILGVSREAVHKLIRSSPRIRAWSFYAEPESDRAELVYISVRDLVRHGVQRGYLHCAEDSALSFCGLAEEIALARQAVDKAEAALLY